MKISPDIEIVDGTTFELRPHDKFPSNPDWVCLRKNREFTNRYLTLANEFRGGRIVEVGVDQGGSTSFFKKLLSPERMISIELSDQPVGSVVEFMAENDPDGRVSIHWGVDQSDRVAVPQLIDAAFSDQALDLVVDDASHLLAPSTATFEMLFPRIRPGGLYILEDWSSTHLRERGILQALQNDSDGTFQARWEAMITAGVKRPVPMSILICQLVIAAGRNPDWIAEVRATDGFCEVRRGPPISSQTRLFQTMLVS